MNQLSAKLANHIKRMASFRNPDFYAKQAMRFSTHDTPLRLTHVDRLEIDLLDDATIAPRPHYPLHALDDPIVIDAFDPNDGLACLQPQRHVTQKRRFIH